MKKQNFRSDIVFSVFDTDYSFRDINYTTEDIDYTTEDIGFITAYKGYGMLAAPEAVSLQLAWRTGPNPSGTRLYFAHLSLSSLLFHICLDFSFLLSQY